MFLGKSKLASPSVITNQSGITNLGNRFIPFL